MILDYFLIFFFRFKRMIVTIEMIAIEIIRIFGSKLEFNDFADILFFIYISDFGGVDILTSKTFGEKFDTDGPKLFIL